MSNPYLDDAAVERQRKADRTSKLMGERMLMGWKMLAETCPCEGCYVPLLENKAGEKLCVACNPDGKAPTPKATPIARAGVPVSSSILSGSDVRVLDAPQDWASMSQEELLAFAQRGGAATVGSAAGPGMRRTLATEERKEAPHPTPVQRVQPAPAVTHVPAAPKTSGGDVRVLDAPSGWMSMSEEELLAFAQRGGVANGTAAGPGVRTAAAPKPRDEPAPSAPTLGTQTSVKPAMGLPAGGDSVVSEAIASLLKAVDHARMQLDVASGDNFATRQQAAQVMAEAATAIKALQALQ